MKIQRMHAACGLLMLAAVATIAYVQIDNQGRGANVLRLQPGDAAVRALGQQVYAEHCASCHGARLEGQADWQSRSASGLLPAPPHDASGHTWHHPDDLLFRLTKLGVSKTLDMPDYKSNMPAFEGVLSDQEIVAALSWIKSQWPQATQQRHDELNALSLRDQAR